MAERDRSKLVEKVKHLRALAKDQSGKPEGDLAMELCQRIMIENAISEADFDTGNGEAMQKVKYDLKKRLNWKRTLLAYVSKFCSCIMTYGVGSTNTYLYGNIEDIEVAKYLYEIVARQIDDMAREYYQERIAPRVRIKRLTRGEARRYRTAYVCSAVLRVGERLLELRDGRTKHEKGLMKFRLDDAQRFFDAETANENVSEDDPSFEFSMAGYQAGEGVSLTHGLKAASVTKKPKGLLN